MFAVGLSTCSKDVNENLFAAYAGSGIKYMEISPRETEHADFDFKSAAELAKKYGVALWSYHLPFSPFAKIDPSNTAISKQTLETFSELIKRAASVGIDKVIVHPSGEPIDDAERAERMNCAKNALAELCESAKKEGVTVAVENLPRTCLGKNSAEIKELIGLNPDLRVCFDTNHLLSEDFADFIDCVGDKIITIHVSDYDFVNERHWLPGEGKLDFTKLAAKLKDAGYAGPWLYEIGFSCPNTIFRDRDLVCEDFVRNAEEIFGGKKITVFSKPKPNLGMWE